jgi:chemotaxis family two-component system response regulator PixG
MHPEATLSPNQIQHYSVTKRMQLLKALKRIEFSGKLIWSNSIGQQWIIFLNLGTIVYGTGGSHVTRRWQRSISSRYPDVELEVDAWDDDLVNIDDTMLSDCWDYQILYAWVARQKITEDQFSQIIQDIVAEILFDINQATDLTYKLQRSQPLNTELIPIQINEDAVITTVQKLWKAWVKAELERYSPNLAPVMRKPEQIRVSTSPQTYQMLVKSLDGKQTLRDLAVTMRRDILQLTQALQSYIQLNWIELIQIPDLPGLILPSKPKQGSSSSPDTLVIACVDDSVMICQSMEQVIKAAGYQFVAIMDAPRAIATLLAKRPNLIFLDLIMPDTNGYEICSQLRKVSMFKDTPIIILTGNDGLVDQVRARLLGASDFISKPVDPTVITSIIRKYLGQMTLT